MCHKECQLTHLHCYYPKHNSWPNICSFKEKKEQLFRHPLCRGLYTRDREKNENTITTHCTQTLKFDSFQVFSMLIVLQIVNQLQETAMPVFLKRPSTRRVMCKVSKRFSKNPDKSKHDCKHCEVEKVRTNGRCCVWYECRNGYISCKDDLSALHYLF